MSYTSQKQKNISTDFISSLTKMLDSIERISDTIKEGEYLELMGLLKDLHKFKDKFNENVIVKQHRDRFNSAVRSEVAQMTREEKLASDKYELCTRCDRIVLSKNIHKHQRRAICESTLQKKRVSSLEGSTFINQKRLIKIENTDYKELVTTHIEERDRIKEETKAMKEMVLNKAVEKVKKEVEEEMKVESDSDSDSDSESDSDSDSDSD